MYNLLIFYHYCFSNDQPNDYGRHRLIINIRQVNDKLTVAVMPRRAGLKDEAGEQIVPLVLNGTPEELDMEFLGAITAPVQKAQGILTNLETFEKQAEQAVSQSKAAKSVARRNQKRYARNGRRWKSCLKRRRTPQAANAIPRR